MTSIYCNRFCRTLAVAVLSIVTFEFSPRAQGNAVVDPMPNHFMFTNATPAMPRRANIILIVADGLGYGDLSCYGQTKFQTPNLDKLAADGIRFTSYYAGDAASSPSRAALLLGKDSGHIKQRADLDIPLAADETTVAQILKSSGYHTGLIGEWDLGDENSNGAPWRKGFDEFAGYIDPAGAENFFADYIFRYAPLNIPNPTNHPPDAFIGRAAVFANTGGKKDQYIPDLFTKAALNFAINNQPDPFNHYKPFFLLLNFTIPHAGNGMPVPTDAPFSDESWPQPEKNKAAMISRLDGYVGQLLEQLQKIHQDSNTVVFFTSDSGPHTNAGVSPQFFSSAGPFRGARGDLYEGGLRVPLIVRWPGKIPAGQISDLPLSAWDFLPTAVDIALAQSPANLDGVSVLPVLLKKPLPKPHTMFFRWELRGSETAQAARLGDWKAVRTNASEKWELYHIKNDPNETENVAGKYPEIIKFIEETWKACDEPKYGSLIRSSPVSTNGANNP
jgi:arylsulfatase A-like enzyme